jgi:vitamin B12 transporter
VRGYARLSSLDGRWVNQIEAVLNDTRNDNFDAGAFLNRSNGTVSKLAYQSTIDFKTGPADNRITGAIEHERQSFASIDVDPTALSNQRRSRNQTSVIGEYRFGIGEVFAASTSLRYDSNTQYGDSTTFRTTAALALPQGVRAHASYGEGVNDPGFFDLYGFFPAFFVGNPDLVPEKSRGWDAGLGWKSDQFAVDITYFHANLTDEIVSTFNSSTFLSGVANASGSSRRQGVEVSASTTLTDWLRLDASYAYLDATEQKISTGLALRELRRPKNSGSLTATVKHGAWQSAVSAAWVGERVDTNFATFSRQTLPGYVLVTVSGSYKINDRIALTGRVENAGDARYQDVIGYRTLGIGAYAGVKLNWGK